MAKKLSTPKSSPAGRSRSPRSKAAKAQGSGAAPASVAGLDASSVGAGAPTSSVFIHAAALVDSERLGAGTRVWAFTHVMAGAVIGRDCNLGEHVFVENGVVLGDRVTVKNGVQLWTGVRCEDLVFIGPNATFTNDLRPRVTRRLGTDELLATTVRRGASIGANATVLCGVDIGAHALIGAGAVVLRDVPAHALIVGNPGKRIGWVCRCGATLAGRRCPSCGTRYRRENGGLAAI